MELLSGNGFSMGGGGGGGGSGFLVAPEAERMVETLRTFTIDEAGGY
jgi:hypothetical protein